MSDRPVSGYRVEQVLSTWMAARARLLQDDSDLAHDEAALTELLGGETQDVQDILARLLRAAVHAKSMADAAGEQIDAMKGRQERFKRRSDSMKGTAYAILESIGQTKPFILPDLTASFRKSPPSVAITDESAIPDQFVHISRTPDKVALLAELKARSEQRQTMLADASETGEILDDASLPQPIPGAELTNGLISLSIRTK